ncbi:unnamed protein product [Amaranthus hypochondriacus]
MQTGNGQLSVPPGFRFHPTDEELLYYYLKKKVSYEAIDLDVIREVDLNKLEPWDLKDRCRIGSGPQNEWYFFSHKDKKYPTGTRTNRATAAGFWKATGRDKAIYLGNSKRIGMRKTLVFYTGRAPHGHKTDWIMHEYRLNDQDSQLQQEDGWVVCRVFKKKNHGRGLQTELNHHDYNDNDNDNDNNPNTHITKPPTNNFTTTSSTLLQPKQHPYNSSSQQPFIFPTNYLTDYTFDGTMHLPQLSNIDSLSNNVGSVFSAMDNLLRLSTSNGGLVMNTQANGGNEMGLLDKLIANYQEEATQSKIVNHDEIVGMSSNSSVLQYQPKFPFQYNLSSEFSK